MLKKISKNLYILVLAKYTEIQIRKIFQQKRHMMEGFQVFLTDLVMMKAKDLGKPSDIYTKTILKLM